MLVRKFSRRRCLVGFTAAAALLLVSACGGHDPRLRSHVAAPSGPAVAPHWDYDAEGPDHWADLDHAYRTCQNGHEQSPIDLPSHTRLEPDEHIDIHYATVPALELINNGHTVQANLPAGNGNRLVIGGAEFELAQFHFHLPSEHTVDGAGTAMELHLVHKNGAGALAVLGVLLQAGAGPSPLDQILAAAPAAGVPAAAAGLDLRALLPADLDQFRYRGSLTTPPCSEGVSWTVLEHPVAVGSAGVDRYRMLFAHSNRPTQPLYGRAVTLAGN
ncbi:carbonic anhydrase [Nocardia brasiliensis]|uniref:carbonic anhydrase n=1 Tax=Nocardia brasiliensis TaxID=37326 RepID=UPI0002D8D243|nr:carbonic anhydrase family protein [Nocardia brasiliensis]